MDANRFGNPWMTPLPEFATGMGRDVIVKRDGHSVIFKKKPTVEMRQKSYTYNIR